MAEEKKQNGITHWEPVTSSNLGKNIVPGYRFIVYIQGIKMGFSKITNLETFIETDPLVEGGVNTYAHSLIRPVSREKLMTFERGALGVSEFSVVNMMMLGRFQVGQRIPTDIVIAVCGRGGAVEKMYFVHGAMVKSWKCSDLNAMSGQLLIETFEVVYETLEEKQDLAIGASIFGSII